MVAGTSSKNVYMYMPKGAQNISSGQPTLSTLTGPARGVYTLTGSRLNGLTNGASDDDEGQNYTSFPVISLSWAGNTKYAVVTGLSNMSISPTATNTVTFRLPPGIPQGVFLNVAVTASGLRSSNSLGLIAPP